MEHGSVQSCNRGLKTKKKVTIKSGWESMNCENGRLKLEMKLVLDWFERINPS